MLALLAVILSTFTLLAALAGALPFVLVAFGLFFGGLILMGRGWARWRLYRRITLLFGPTTENPASSGEPVTPADRPRE
jgi:hypothetical protein